MEYAPIIIYLFLSFVLAIVILRASFFAAIIKPDFEKSSAYECRFDPFDDARGRFDVRFYLVAILFIIFDLEVTFCFPWSLTLMNRGIFSFNAMVIFLLLLTVRFVFEWKKGALDWELIFFGV